MSGARSSATDKQQRATKVAEERALFFHLLLHSPTMLMVQKQPSFNISSHRRHPSAPPPVIVVQPTRTPGLLSLRNQRSPQARQQNDKLQTHLSLSYSTSKHRQPPEPPASLSDPFLVTSTPSGKLARRRHNPSPKQPQPQPQHKPFSLPLPLPRQRPTKQRSNVIPDFPICDDMTEVGDLSDLPSPPRTPTRPRNPISPSTYTRGASSPAFTPPAVLSAAGNRGPSSRSHRRAPSEGGVFHMSSDEGSASEESLSTFSRPVDTKAFLDSITKNRRSSAKPRSSPPKSHRQGLSSSAPFTSSFAMHTPVRKEKERQLEAQAQQAGYFASSSFQNSPSPEDLPDPLLI